MSRARVDVDFTALDDDDAQIGELLFSDDVRALLLDAHDRFDQSRQALLRRRERVDPAALPADDGAEWQVPPAPPGLVRRHVEITGPPDRRMAVHALSSGADVWMGDLEDATSPTWRNIVRGHAVLRDAVSGQLLPSSTRSKTTVVARTRGLHLEESAVRIDGEPVAAALVDHVLWAYGPHRALRSVPPYVYLPKLESAEEAAWWAGVFALVDEARRDGATTRASVLIETLPAALDLDGILRGLREHACAVNAGRWDYLFSAIKRRPDGGPVFPDRGALTMQTPFLRAYAERTAAVAHRRGAHAIGGMAAMVPSRRDPEQTELAIARVREDKRREAAQGFDGSWVAHPDLVPVCAEVFAEALDDRDHQLDKRPPVPAPRELLDFATATGEVTARGVAANVRVSLQYIHAWLNGSGAIAIDGLMEDAATAEIARAQLWEWSRPGALVPPGDISRLIDEESAALAGSEVAANVLRRLALDDELEEFLPFFAGGLLRSGQ